MSVCNYWDVSKGCLKKYRELEQKVSALEKENSYLMDCFGPWMDAVNEAFEQCHALEEEIIWGSIYVNADTMKQCMVFPVVIVMVPQSANAKTFPAHRRAR